MKITLGEKEIVGEGKWKFTSVPWYLRWWTNWKLNRCYKKHESDKKEREKKHE
jgi:hypothetical protein